MCTKSRKSLKPFKLIWLYKHGLGYCILLLYTLYVAYFISTTIIKELTLYTGTFQLHKFCKRLKYSNRAVTKIT